MLRRSEEEGCHMEFRGLLKVSVQQKHQAILSVPKRFDPYMAHWDLNSQPKDNPYAISIDWDVQIHCANGV